MDTHYQMNNMQMAFYVLNHILNAYDHGNGIVFIIITVIKSLSIHCDFEFIVVESLLLWDAFSSLSFSY